MVCGWLRAYEQLVSHMRNGTRTLTRGVPQCAVFRLRTCTDTTDLLSTQPECRSRLEILDPGITLTMSKVDSTSSSSE